MKRFIHFGGIAMVIAAVITVPSSPAQAGRVGGPKSLVSTVPAGASVYFDIPFAAGETAVVAITGDGSTIMHVVIYDSDGNMVIGDGVWDRRTAILEVFRSGIYRVEVRNLGNQANTFTMTTN